MKSKLAASTFLVGALLLSAAAFSADYDADRVSPTAYLKETTITAKIKAEMAKDQEVSALRIKVSTDDNGTMTLSGTARSQREIDKAVAIARGIDGVVNVDNKIQILAN